MTAPAPQSGRVVDADGRPVAHAYIVIVDGPEPMPEIALLADEVGRFSVLLPPGRWTLRAHGTTGGTGETVAALPDPQDIVIPIGR